MSAHLKLATHPVVLELEREAAVLGTNNQRERWAAGVLPEDELLALARNELFKPFTGMRPWHNRNLRPSAVRHAPACKGGQHTIDFETCEPNDLSHEQWEVLGEIRAGALIAADHHWIVRSLQAVGEATQIPSKHWNGVRVEPLMHWATCRVCKAEEFRASAKVHILWAGRSLIREFAL